MADNMETIAHRLHHMDLNNSQSALADQPAQPGHESERKKSHSGTPPRLVLVDEISPTDTAFSDQSIFDSPYQHCASNPGSPVTPRGGHDDVFVDMPNTIAVRAGDAWKVSRETNIQKFQKLVDIRRGVNRVPPPGTEISSVAESDADTEISDYDYDEPPSTTDNTNHSPRRFVMILSCYQCVMAGLPCSRSYPACSRCERAGNADTCLLFRRKLVGESTREIGFNITPTLLLVEGEDEGVRKRKVALLQEFHQKWQDDLDRKNWVYPPIEGKLGTYRTHGRKMEPDHPGEGIGRVTIRELPLVKLHSAL